MLISHSWLKDYLGENLPSAKEVADLLGAHSFEIEDMEEKNKDTVIDIDILPNRASDCLCHRGIAREVATLIEKDLQNDPLNKEVTLQNTNAISVEIEDSKACPRFTASLITDIEVKESPDWLKERLEVIGQRSINNIVDATNYVMFAIGQPIHAYDADLFPQVDGRWQFGVRFAKENEEVSLIAEGGKDEDRIVTLKGAELLIVDNSSNIPIGLAGVKGGRYAGVHKDSKNIIVEAAHFDPILTRKTARGLGIVIDASKRFENEPSRDLPPISQQEIVDLIIKIAGGKCEGMIDEYLEKVTPTKTLVSVEHTNSLLGLSLTQKEMTDILARVGCEVSEGEGSFEASGPFERTDLNIEEDYIEEIGRVHGYTHVKSIVPESVDLSEYNVRHYYSEKIRGILISLGFSEIITSSFRKKDEISLLNALASDKGCLRSSLVLNVAESLEKNAGFSDLLGTSDTRVFEIGTVFKKGDGCVNENVALCVGARIKQSGHSKKDDDIVEEAISALSSELDSDLSFDKSDGVAETNLSKVIEKLGSVASYDSVGAVEDVQYKAFSVYPHMSRDIALWVSEGTSIEDVENVLNQNAGELRVRTTLFDKFTKDGKVSYAFRIVFQSNEETLTDEKVNIEMEGVYAAVLKEGWEVR